MTTPAAASPQVAAGVSAEAALPFDAVVMASFGGPEGPDDVMPFLRNVVRGKDIPEDRLAIVASHYDGIAGVSPLNDCNRTLRAELEAELARRGTPLPVLWGNRNWHPFLAEALAEADAAGYRRLLVLPTSPFSSYSSCRQYAEDIENALDESKLAGHFEITKAGPFPDAAGLVDPVVDAIAAGYQTLAAEGFDPEQVRLLMTTHSIPYAMAERSGPDGWRYVAQLQRLAGKILAGLAGRPSVPDSPRSRLIYQSRSGPPSQRWLDPDIEVALDELGRAGVKAVIVSPIGFVSDHVEVVVDLDEFAGAVAEKHGMRFLRTQTAGPDPRFVASMADVVARNIARPDPPCPGNCCVPLRRPST